MPQYSDSISRMLEGVLPNDEAKELESHYNGLLEYPQYTRPYEWNGIKVPDVLISGHHGNIEKWRREQSILMTAKHRPDMLNKAELTEKDKDFLKKNKVTKIILKIVYPISFCSIHKVKDEHTIAILLAIIIKKNCPTLASRAVIGGYIQVIKLLLRIGNLRLIKIGIQVCTNRRNPISLTSKN